MSARTQTVTVSLEWHGIDCTGYAELELGAPASLHSPADPVEILDLTLYDEAGVEVPVGPDDWEQDDLYTAVIESAHP